MAKGVRKTKSRFGARLEPMSHVALQLYEGRELDIVTQAESIDHFRAIRDDLDRLTRAVAMLEAVDQLAQEREPNPRLYQMLLGALRTLGRDSRSARGAGVLLEGARPRGLPARARPLRDVRERRPTRRLRPRVGRRALPHLSAGRADQPGRARPASVASSAAGSAAALDEPASPTTHEVEHLADAIARAPPRAPPPLDDRPRPRLTPVTPRRRRC